MCVFLGGFVGGFIFYFGGPCVFFTCFFSVCVCVCVCVCVSHTVL